jgi:hypothetical protein
VGLEAGLLYRLRYPGRTYWQEETQMREII